MVNAQTIGLLCLVALVASACTSSKRDPAATGLLVVVRSDLEPEVELERLELETRRHDGERRSAMLTIAREMTPGRVVLPASFTIYARPQDIVEGVRLRISGYGPGDSVPRVQRLAELGFERKRLLRVVIDLSRACEGRHRECEAVGKTCGGDGRCIDIAIDAMDLQPVLAGEETRALPLFPAPASSPGQETNHDGRSDAQVASDAGDQRRDGEVKTGPSHGNKPDGDASKPGNGRMNDAGPREAGMDGSMADAAGGGIRPNDGDVGDATAPRGKSDASSGSQGKPDAADPGIVCGDARITCHLGELVACANGAVLSTTACEYGCYEGANACNECTAGEQTCVADTLRVCTDGYLEDLPCPLGCSLDGRQCLGCIGPVSECDAEGQLRTCQLDGQWKTTSCFEGCADEVTGDDDAGASETAMCTRCAPGEARCEGRDIVSCGPQGVAIPWGCGFGCEARLVCSEHTPIGQALIVTIID